MREPVAHAPLSTILASMRTWFIAAPRRARSEHTFSQCLPHEQGQRGTDRPQSYCSLVGGLSAPRSRHPFRASYRRLSPVAQMRAWRSRTSPDGLRIPARGGRTRDPRGWSVSHGAAVRAYREFCVRDIPSVPRHLGRRVPCPREADGLQLASSWTRDGRIVPRLRGAGISRAQRGERMRARIRKPGHKVGQRIRYHLNGEARFSRPQRRQRAIRGFDRAPPRASLRPAASPERYPSPSCSPSPTSPTFI